MLLDEHHTPGVARNSGSVAHARTELVRTVQADLLHDALESPVHKFGVRFAIST